MYQAFDGPVSLCHSPRFRVRLRVQGYTRTLRPRPIVQQTHCVPGPLCLSVRLRVRIKFRVRVPEEH